MVLNLRPMVVVQAPFGSVTFAEGHFRLYKVASVFLRKLLTETWLSDTDDLIVFRWSKTHQFICIAYWPSVTTTSWAWKSRWHKGHVTWGHHKVKVYLDLSESKDMSFDVSLREKHDGVRIIALTLSVQKLYKEKNIWQFEIVDLKSEVIQSTVGIRSVQFIQSV